MDPQKSKSNFAIDALSDDLSKRSDLGPSPQEFGECVTWACVKLPIDVKVNVVKIRLHDYVSSTEKTKAKKHKVTGHLSKHTNMTQDESIKLNKTLYEDNYDVITIISTHDNNDNLVQLKFDGNKKIPRVLFKVIGLVINYHTYLNTVTINRGIDNASIYELNKLLHVSNITDICLDGTFIPGANYHTLLENKSNLRQLSLARCKIDDNIIMKIAFTLTYPLPASKTLIILNLATNRITDTGTKYLASALRSNRKLAYLNLADNSIGDEGAEEILKILIEFPLRNDEVTASKTRYVHFLKKKKNSFSPIVLDSKPQEFDKKSLKKKTFKPSGLASIPSIKKSIVPEEEITEFKDPFAINEIFLKNDKVLCFGNNVLSYLNLSYNDVSYLTVTKLLHVLKTQKILNREPRGLINVSIEGNFIPENCKELSLIGEILQLYLTNNFNRRQSLGRKKTQIYTARSGKS